MSRRRRVACITALLLVVACLVVFNPSLQRRAAMKFAPRYLDAFSVTSLHLLPWSLHVSGLDADYDGAVVHADTIALRFCPTALIGRTVDFALVEIAGARVDLTRFVPPPSPPPDAPFPGVFATLDTGFDLAIERAAVDAKVLLPGDARAFLRVSGGGIAPQTNGELEFQGQFHSPDVEALDVSGAIALDQIEHGRFNNITARVEASADVTALALPEYLNARVTLTPTADPPRTPRDAGDGTTEFVPTPDAVAITLVQQDADGLERGRLALDAQYDGVRGVLDGSYIVSANEKLPAPYVGEGVLPAFAQSGSGDIELDVMTLAGSLSLKSETLISELARLLGDDENIPAEIALVQDLGLRFSPQELTIERLRSVLARDDGTTLLDATLPQPLTLDPANPAALLAHKLPLLQLQLADILLAWFNALVPDLTISGGVMSGRFSIEADGEERVVLATEAPLTLDGLRLDHGEDMLFDNARLVFEPRITATPKETRVVLNKAEVSIGDDRIATLQLNATLPRADEAIALETNATLVLDPLLALPAIEGRMGTAPLPPNLTASLGGKFSLRGESARIRQFTAALKQGGDRDLVRVKALQALTVTLGDQVALAPGIEGEAAEIALENIELAWLNPFIGDYTLSGDLRGARFGITAGANGAVTISPNAPLEIAALDLDAGGEALLENIYVRLSPRIAYDEKQIRVDYDGLDIAAGKRRIANGEGNVVVVPANADTALSLTAGGHLELALNRLVAQPVVARQLTSTEFETPWTSEFSYAVSVAGESIEIGAIDLELRHEARVFAELESRTGLRVKPTLAPGENLAQHAIGEVRLSINELTPAILGDLIAGAGIAFDAVNGEFVLTSDGTSLHAHTQTPLSIDAFRITSANGPAPLHPLSITSSARIDTRGTTLEASLDELALRFAHRETTALSGSLALSVDPDLPVPLRRLRAKLTGALVPLLDQPAVLPGHGLTSGTLTTTIAVDPDGTIVSDTALAELASNKPLAVNSMTMPLKGTMRADGRGFDFSAPIIGSGRSGTSNATATGEYAPKADEPALLRINIDSELFYLNDILATVDGISGKAPAAAPSGETSAAAAPVVVDDTIDESAFWNVLPYDTLVSFAFDRVFYSDYVAFDRIKGALAFGDDALQLQQFQAFFHDSPIEFDGGLTFTADDAEPYAADFTGRIKDFDLNQFFSELTPDKESRIEGLFGVDIAVGGRAPNASQFRNQLLLDMKLQSRDGLFRPLPPDSVLMVGASGALGLIGEGLSYIPTGGFGAGAVSRLVNYIAEIEYDSVDLHIKRDETLDLKIARMNMLSPTIRMSGKGVIHHEYGKDIVESPLDVSARLSMTGKGAAILYSIDLLEDEQDKFGYWKGPEFKLSGTLTETESNLEDIVQRAADGSVKGGITRPISGLIGNIKYRWFGGDAEVDAAQRELDQGEPAPAPGPEPMSHEQRP